MDTVYGRGGLMSFHVSENEAQTSGPPIEQNQPLTGRSDICLTQHIDVSEFGRLAILAVGRLSPFAKSIAEIVHASAHGLNRDLPYCFLAPAGVSCYTMLDAIDVWLRIAAAAEAQGERPSVSFDWVAARLPLGCAVTGEPFDLASERSPWSPSLRRIDPEGPWEEANAQLVSLITSTALHNRYPDAARMWTAALLDPRGAAAMRAPSSLPQDIRFWMKRIRSKAKSRATAKGIPFALSELFISRKLAAGRCEATGLPFCFSTGSPWVPSPDQIVPSGGYTEDNVRLVVSAFNYGRCDWPDEEVHRFARAFWRMQGRRVA